MKKIFSLFFVLSTVVFFSNIVFAAEIFSIDFYDISTDNSTEKKISWDVTKITPGTNKWVWSTTYAKVKAQDIPKNTVYYMYQDNKNGSTYKAEKFRTEEEDGVLYHRYSGLVNKDKKGGEDKGFVPLSYVFVSAKLDSSAFEKEYEPKVMIGDKEDPYDVLHHRSGRFFMDRSDMYMDGDDEKSNYERNKGYCAIAGSNKYRDGGTIIEKIGNGPVFWYYDEKYGIDGWVRWTSDRIIDHTAYMYFGANFENASRNDIFGTNKIIIERFTE